MNKGVIIINGEDLYSRSEICTRFGISYVSLDTWRKNGLLPQPTRKIGRTFYYDKQAIEDMTRLPAE